MKIKLLPGCLIVFGAVLLMFPCIARSTTGEAPEAVIREMELVENNILLNEESPGDMTIEQRLRQRGNFRFVDEDIRTVLRSLARAFEFNITLAPEIEGRVTVDFSNVEVLNALDTILRDHGFGYIITGDIVRVTTLDKIRLEEEAERFRKEQEAQRALEDAARAKADAERTAAEVAAEPLEVRVFRLRYIDAEDAKNAIEPLITPGRGKVTVLKTRQFTGFTWELTQRASPRDALQFERSTTLIVQDTPTSLRGIEAALEKLDRKPHQILIAATIVEVPVNHDFRLGVDWSQALDRWQVGASDLEAIFFRDRERRRDFRDDARSIRELEIGEAADRDRSRLTSEGRISSDLSGRDRVITRTQAGLVVDDTERQASERSFVRTFDALDTISDREWSRALDSYVATVADTMTRIATTGESYTAVLSAAPFNLMLSAMKTDSEVVFLSNPRVIVQENYAAAIHIGEKYPILKAEASGTDRAVGGFSLDYWQDIGITLKVIPQVRESRDGTRAINMIVHPVVSLEKERIVAGVGEYATEYPVLSLREADTNVTISDGDTIVIGGLIQSDTVERISKIPLLGDIPLLGYLFKERYTSLEKKNILVFITARLVDETSLSFYERMMLEKAPPEVLGDIIRTDDEQLRPHLYIPPIDVPFPEDANGDSIEADDNPGTYYLYDRNRDGSTDEREEADRRGEISRARERSLRR